MVGSGCGMPLARYLWVLGAGQLPFGEPGRPGLLCWGDLIAAAQAAKCSLRSLGDREAAEVPVTAGESGRAGNGARSYLPAPGSPGDLGVPPPACQALPFASKAAGEGAAGAWGALGHFHAFLFRFSLQESGSGRVCVCVCVCHHLVPARPVGWDFKIWKNLGSEHENPEEPWLKIKRYLYTLLENVHDRESLIFVTSGHGFVTSGHGLAGMGVLG